MSVMHQSSTWAPARTAIKQALRLLKAAAVAAAFSALAPLHCHAADITVDTVWSGTVTVSEDTRVVEGATLTIEPGTTLEFLEAFSTKTDPQYWSPNTELLIDGRLVAEGEPARRIRFVPAEVRWGGIVVGKGGEAVISYADVVGAEEALLLAGGATSLGSVKISGSDYGIVVGPGAEVVPAEVTVLGCEKGVVDLRGPAYGRLPGVEVKDASDAAYLSRPWGDAAGREQVARVKGAHSPASRPATGRELLGEYTVEGEEVWSGLTVITGRVTVPPGSMLRLEPGATVLFRKVDTNEDGLGEGELLVLGSIRSTGTPERPVVFGSAEDDPHPGDWDKVSIISSEDTGNVFVNTQFMYGVQALHAHFSSLSARSCLFEGNFRALQFQESERVTVQSCIFVNNKQAMRFRDSSV